MACSDQVAGTGGAQTVPARPRRPGSTTGPGDDRTPTAGEPWGSGAVSRRRSDRADVLRLRALLALGDVELDALRLVQRPVAAPADRGEVAEDVGAAISRSEEHT